ncbi:LytTR family DNA-binding domain-containing protein [Clostridium oceanicum]|uniref:Stage 0 sporulation protein A homolog n=1 Tax=Clostridium oceanicum TaxID=1543 RepID=A0ABP3UMV7_9CLOT
MIEVMICDDNTMFRNNIRRIIENTILRENLDLKITVCTENPKEVLEYVKENNNTGIYFLDVDLKSEINGIRLGEKIRDLDSRGFIIFTTVHMEMSYLVFKYKVQAMDYVIKDEDGFKERVNSCLLKAYNTYLKSDSKDKYISIKEDFRIINIRLKDILFIETSSTAHKIRVHEENRQVEFYGNLKEIQKKLTPNFYRCHKSYIVNKDKIGEIDLKNNKIIMANSEECYVSFRYKKGLL